MTTDLESLKPEEQQQRIMIGLPMLDEVREALKIILVTNYNLARGQDPDIVFNALRVLNRWNKETIESACHFVAQVIEEVGGALGAAFYEETAEGPEEGQPGFSLVAVNNRFLKEVEEQTTYSGRAQAILRMVSGIALALNIPDPTQKPPEPSVSPTPRPNLVFRVTKSLKGLRLPPIFETTEPTEEAEVVGWTTPPVWRPEDLQDFEFLEVVETIVLGDEPDKWEALRSYNKDLTRDLIENLLKCVAEVATKQVNQSKAIVENTERSRDSFLEMLEHLIWLRKVSDSVLSSSQKAS